VTNKKETLAYYCSEGNANMETERNTYITYYEHLVSPLNVFYK